MQMNQTTDRRSEQGFTLVELAIVLIIVGLLIGGILKGQELIGNARINATVSQIKAIDAAMSTFRDKYNAIPGDMSTATTRLPNCSGACANGGGDGVLATGFDVAMAATTEDYYFWQHMSAADLITGITNSTAIAIGTTVPEAEVGGAIRVNQVAAAADAPGVTSSTGLVAGVYLALTSEPSALLAATLTSLNANQAARIDIKLDDGRPNTGSVRGLGAAAAATDCTAGTAVTDVYSESVSGSICGLYARIQG